jgi:hypothetical protein
MAQGMCLNSHDVDWAIHACIRFARAQVENASRVCYNHISMRSTKNTQYDTTVEHEQLNQLHARVQNNRAFFLNRIRQT